MPRPFQRFEADLKEFTSARVIELALALHDRITVPTPVDTGWAQANWIPAIGEQEETPKPNLYNPASVEASRAQQKTGLRSLASYRLGEDEDITILNNVPYINDLNIGTSTKAPAAFVQTAIQRAIDEVT